MSESISFLASSPVTRLGIGISFVRSIRPHALRASYWIFMRVASYAKVSRCELLEFVTFCSGR